MEANEAYREIAAKFDNQDNPYFLRLLEYLMTPDQVRVAAELPAPTEEIASKLGMDVATVTKHIDDMFFKGLVFPRDFKVREGSRFARNIVQLHDATQSNLFMDHKANKGLYDVWEAFSREGGGDRQYALTYVKRWEETGGVRRSRVVPAYQSIKNNPDMIPADDIREVFKNASLIAVVACSCRKRADAVGHSCEKSHEGNCFQFGRGAEYQLAKGTGRQLTHDEAIKILEETEEDGLVHSWVNSSNMSGGSVLCSCCHDCCVDWDRLTRNDVPISYRWEKSRYVAQIDADLCNGCQNCYDRCQFDAIEMVKPEGSRKYKAVMDEEKCFGCGVCTLDCAPDAINLKAIRPPEFIPAG